MLTGLQLRDEQLDIFEQEEAEWLEKARMQARIFCVCYGPVTSDDLWERCPPKRPNAMGAVFKSKGWKHIGYQKSTRPQAHGRIIGRWEYVG